MTMGNLFLMAGLGGVKNSRHEGGTLCRFTCSFIYSLPVYPGPAVYRGLWGPGATTRNNWEPHFCS